MAKLPSFLRRSFVLPYCLIVRQPSSAICIPSRSDWGDFKKNYAIDKNCNTINVKQAQIFMADEVISFDKGSKIAIFNNQKMAGWIFNSADVVTLEQLYA